jgi:triphosphoribosyl-dephospho-CoA synthase
MKPGNVSEMAAGHGMTAEDFYRSAAVSAGAVCDPASAMGERVHNAVLATRAAVGCNTNLGILLLCAPLVQAATRMRPGQSLRGALAEMLSETTVEDTEQVFAAVRIANPGGLGKVSKHDVHDRARVGLCAAMSEAAGRDRIAGQYKHGFADLFDDALPHYRAARSLYGDERLAVTDLYLYLLARFADSHVQRKHGIEVAEALRDEVGELYADWTAKSHAGCDLRLTELDLRLKAAGVNPGTTADLTVATLFLERLLNAVALKSGAARRRTLRHLRFAYCGAPLNSTLLTGESRKWL